MNLNNMMSHLATNSQGFLDYAHGQIYGSETNEPETPTAPTYGDVTQEVKAEPYLRRSQKGTDTRLTSNRRPTKVKNKAYGTVGG